MKRFTKICLFTAAIAAVLGIICGTIGLALGASWNDLSYAVNDTRIYNYLKNHDSRQQTEAVSSAEGEGAAAKETKDGKTTFRYDNYTGLDMEIGMGTLAISRGDTDQIEVTVADENQTSVYGDGDMLYVQADVSGSKDGGIEITIPRQLTLMQVNLELGAGSANIRELKARNIDIEVGAGKLDMTLDGRQKDYSFDMSCGVGQIKLGDKTYSGLGQDEYVKGDNADKEVDIECGAGQAVIGFTEK